LPSSPALFFSLLARLPFAALSQSLAKIFLYLGASAESLLLWSQLVVLLLEKFIIELRLYQPWELIGTICLAALLVLLFIVGLTYLAVLEFLQNFG
jgi:hypothetical protein